VRDLGLYNPNTVAYEINAETRTSNRSTPSNRATKPSTTNNNPHSTLERPPTPTPTPTVARSSLCKHYDKYYTVADGPAPK
jgi:hypothetical protein